VTNQSRVYGAVEAGGTKFVCAIGDESGRVLKQERFPTQDSASTLARMQLFLHTITKPNVPQLNVIKPKKAKKKE